MECWYTKFTSAPAISIPAPSAISDEVEPLANVINLSSITNCAVFNVTVLPCTTKSPPTITSPVVVTFANVTLFSVPTPCIVPVPSNVSNLLSILALNVVTLAALALIEVAIEPLNVEYPVVCAISVCDEPLNNPTESILVCIVVLIDEVNECKFKILTSTEPDLVSNSVNLPSCTACDAANEELNAVWDAALALNEVATDELKSPVTLATLALNADTEASLALNEVATEPLNVSNPVVEEIVTCDEPEITPSTSNLSLIVVAIDEVNKFKFVIETPAPAPTLADNAVILALLALNSNKMLSL